MLPEKFRPYHYILASKSPRRQYLMKEMGFEFSIDVRDVDEHFPDTLSAEEIVLFLCELKAQVFDNETLMPDDILITADTIVWHNGKVLGKPLDAAEAKEILMKLNGSMHEVFTGVCLKRKNKTYSFYDRSAVWFKQLTEKQIDHYISHYQPFDKAGAYGVQEWIGYIGVEKIEGSFFNVMGFPTHRFYEELEQFIDNE